MFTKSFKFKSSAIKLLVGQKNIWFALIGQKILVLFFFGWLVSSKLYLSADASIEVLRSYEKLSITTNPYPYG